MLPHDVQLAGDAQLIPQLPPAQPASAQPPEAQPPEAQPPPALLLLNCKFPNTLFMSDFAATGNTPKPSAPPNVAERTALETGA